MDKVSVIIPCYNNAAYIKHAIESALRQTYKEIEVIVIDDCSHDGSQDIIKEFEQHIKVKIIYNTENLGPASARNIGIKHAEGEYIAFLDADDMWDPDKIDHQIKIFEQYPYALLVYTNARIIDESGRLIRLKYSPDEVSLAKLLFQNHIVCSSAMYSVTRNGGKQYFPTIRKRQDFALWIKILGSNGVGINTRSVMTNYRITPLSVSRSNKFGLLYFNYMALRETTSLNIFKILFYVFMQSLNSLKNK